MSWEELSWPAWARGAAPLFRVLFEMTYGNYRMHIGDDGEHKIEVTMTITKKNAEWLASVAKRLKLA